MLMPYTYPQSDPGDEDDITMLKTTEIVVDGYHVIVHLNIADYNDRTLNTLQIFGRDLPFLPFTLVVKIARKFLGSECLFLTEIYQENRKVYCWTLIKDKYGKARPYPVNKKLKKVHRCSFEGFDYILMDPKNLSFY